MPEITRITTVHVFETKQQMGAAVADAGAQIVADAIAERGKANIILATGASQFEFLDAFVRRDVDFRKVTMFHLDEYVGLSADHPASFVGYLRQRFASRVPLGEAHWLAGDADDPAAVCREVGRAIRNVQIDAAFVGIGENGHLAFNDPPADFNTTEPYIIVDLDEACRNQQVGEGWFETFDDVPAQAISMSIQEILRARTVFCTCPDQRKADAVKNTLEGLISPDVPASVLRTHRDGRFFLDRPSASRLRGV